MVAQIEIREHPESFPRADTSSPPWGDGMRGGGDSPSWGRNQSKIRIQCVAVATPPKGKQCLAPPRQYMDQLLHEILASEERAYVTEHTLATRI